MLFEKGIGSWLYSNNGEKYLDFSSGIAVTSIGALLFGSPLKWVVMLAPLGFVFYLSARINKMSISAAQITFWIFSAIMGLSLASLFI